MRYHEYPPPSPLAPWIECFWIFEGGGALCETSEVIVADGYPELILNFGQPYAELNSVGEFVSQPVAVVSGQLTRPLVLNTVGKTGIVAIRFKPAGMVPFTQVPMRLMQDARISADAIFANADQLVDQVQMAWTDRQRIACCVNFLMQARRGGSMHSRAANDAVRMIRASYGAVSVATLAKNLNMSKRSLELLFAKHVGVSPKQFCRITRFRHAYDLLVEKRPAVQAAVESGFFDQAHLIRDFRLFAGATPSEFFQRENQLSHALAESPAQAVD